tara:strand:+ start:452 stop:928 length:477 start_codon:yes stop_codon:yes gene_type:complete
MSDIFIDNGFLLYLPEIVNPNLPFWVKVMALSEEIDEIQVDEEDELQCCFYDSEGQVLAIQIHDPVESGGAPVEKAIRFANQVLPNETVYEIIEESRLIKSALGLTNEISQQDFMRIITDETLTEDEMAEKFEGVDNVFFLGESQDELIPNRNLGTGE